MDVSPSPARALPDAAELRLSWGDVVVPVVPATLTGGAFACVRVLAQPFVRRPTYIDHAADEVFHALSGSFAVTTGDGVRVPLGEGAVVHVPRGRTRRLDVVGGSAGTLLVMATPGDQLDELVAALHRTPSAGDEGGVPDARALARHGIEIVSY